MLLSINEEEQFYYK